MASFGIGDRRALTSCKLSLLVALCACFFTYKLQFTHVIKNIHCWICPSCCKLWQYYCVAYLNSFVACSALLFRSATVPPSHVGV